MQIKMCDTEVVLWEGECDNLCDELVAAVKAGANLAGANLAGANLAGANLAGAHLAGAHLAGAHLAGAHLAGANLEGANLEGANLAFANLVGAILTRANLAGAILEGAILVRADLRGADLRGADLAGASAPPVNSHDFWAELLRRAAGDDLHRRMIAGLVLISRDWCWPRMIALMTGELAADWQEWVGAEFWRWPEECRRLGLPELAAGDGPSATNGKGE